MSRKKRVRRLNRSYYLSAAMLFAVFALHTALTLVCLTPKRYSLDENGAPYETIYARFTSEDVVSTEAARQAARNLIPTQYRYNSNLIQEMRTEFSEMVQQIDLFRERAAQIRLETQLLPDEDERTWQEVIPVESLMLMLKAITKLNITDPSIGYAILDSDSSVLNQLYSLLQEELEAAMENGGEGLRYDQISSAHAVISARIQGSSIPEHLKNFGEMLLNAYLKPTLIVDTDETIRLQEETAAEVETIYIQSGQLLAEKGKPLTASQKQILLSLDLLSGASRNRYFIPGIAAYLALFYLAFFVFLAKWEPGFFKDWKQMGALSLILVLNFLLQWVAHTVDPRLMTAAFSVLLCAALFSTRTCVGILMLTCMTIPAVAARTYSGIFSTETAAAMASLFVSGITMLFLIRNELRRLSLMIAGVTGAVLYCAAVSACYMMVGYIWNRQRMVFLLSQGATIVMISLICTGIAGLLETAFDLPTNARLYELSNLNHPLLRRLMMNAPGTYQHSISTAALAENAAYEIGANPLLAKVGALYHDVGKLRRPEYYGENQNGKNIHDTFKPEESAQFIISHVHDAEPLLKKYHLPNEVQRIVREHHGTTLVAYFYNKALAIQNEAEKPEPVNEKLFRYPGGLPSTAESTIVMLADSCEAAVRSIQKPDSDSISKMLNKVISGKIQDGQLADSPMTLAQVEIVRKSFLMTLNGMLHERISYPEDVS